jgi:iron-sulfur cluster repair protein YtfE (RIC family)
MQYKPNSIFSAAESILNEAATKNKPVQKYVLAFQKSINDHEWHHDDDKEMIKMYKNDKADLQRVLDAYKSGDWKRAYRTAENMDTAARDHIHSGIFNQISEA